jgi:hypothetical protein
MNSGMSMRRIQVKARDVVWPFALLMFINVTMLVCVAVAAPYRYQRVAMDSYDRFGRSTEFYGTCGADNSLFYVFVGIMVGVNTIGVLLALHQAWKARNLPTEMSESYYLALSLASFTETLFLGGPILLVINANPTAWYLMSTAVLCVGCVTILLPLMLPKYVSRHQVGSGFSAVGRSPSRSNISGLDLTADSSPLGGFVGASSSLALGPGMMSIRRLSESTAVGPGGASVRGMNRQGSQACRRSRIGGASYASHYSGWNSAGDSIPRLFGDDEASPSPAGNTGQSKSPSDSSSS